MKRFNSIRKRAARFVGILPALAAFSFWQCGAWPASPAAALAGGGSTNTLIIPLGLLIDPFAPQLLSATSENTNTVLLVFTESMETTTSQTAANYCIETSASVDASTNGQSACNGTQLAVTGAAVDTANSAQVRVTTAAQSTVNYRITVSNATDQRGNAIAGINWRFFDGQ